MIINENLLKDSARERHKSNEAGSAWGAIIFYINNLGLEHGKEYTISFEVKNLSKQSNGLVGVFVTSLDGKKDTLLTSLLVSGRISVTFTYDKDISDKIGLSPGPVGDAARCEATFLKVKLEKGKIATEYILNKENVKPENQVIFPIGGVSRSLPSIEDIRGEFMLINPNLSTSSEFKRGVLNVYQDSLDVAFLDDNVLKIKKRKEAELGLIYMSLFNNIEENKIIAFSGKLNLINGREIEIYFNGFSARSLHISNKGLNKIEAIGQKDEAYNQVQLRVYHNDEVIFRFTEIKLEKDKVTPYIPNENTLETAKRPYFIGGGVRSKRFIQSSNYPRQSSFRKEVVA